MQGYRKGTVMQKNQKLKVVLGDKKEHNVKDFRQLLLCLHTHQQSSNMFVMNGCTEKITWDLVKRN